jgi:hypothetical protein
MVKSMSSNNVYVAAHAALAAQGAFPADSELGTDRDPYGGPVEPVDEGEEYFPFEVTATETREVRTIVYARNAREAEAEASKRGVIWARHGGRRAVRALRPAEQIPGDSFFKG